MSAQSVQFDLIVRDQVTPTLAQASRAAAAAFAATLRRCRWLTYWHDTVMPCPERAIPGGALCAEHLIDNERTKP